MTTYISRPISIDTVFRKAYSEVTGEQIQDDPQEAENGMRLCVASARAKDTDLWSLQLIFPEMLYGESMDAVDFKPSAKEG